MKKWTKRMLRWSVWFLIISLVIPVSMAVADRWIVVFDDKEHDGKLVIETQLPRLSIPVLEGLYTVRFRVTNNWEFDINLKDVSLQIFKGPVQIAEVDTGNILIPAGKHVVKTTQVKLMISSLDAPNGAIRIIGHVTWDEIWPDSVKELSMEIHHTISVNGIRYLCKVFGHTC